jgi:serine/threonine protein kinase
MRTGVIKAQNTEASPLKFGTVIVSNENKNCIHEVTYNGQKMVAKVFLDNSLVSEEISMIRLASSLLSETCRNFPHLYNVGYHNYGREMKARKIILLERGLPLDHAFLSCSRADVVRPIVAQLLLPLVELHSRGFLHADVKLKNYLGRLGTPFSSQYKYTHCGTRYNVTAPKPHPELFLIDYELTHRYECGIPLTKSIVCTVSHRPPELIFVRAGGELIYDTKGEAFSFGITILEAVGVMPGTRHFYNENVAKQIENQLREMRHMDDTFSLAYGFEKCAIFAANLLRLVSVFGCPPEGSPFYETPLGKIIFNNLYIIGTHPLYNGVWTHPLVHLCLGEQGIAMLRKALAWDPNERCTCEELLAHPYFAELIST